MKPRVLAIFCLISVLSFGQTNQASISGVVTDAQGAAVPGVKVTMSNVETGLPNSAVTNQAGFYSIPTLQVGSYTLTAEREGFRKHVHQGIALSTGQTLGVDVRLELGSVTETVNVSAEVSLIETRTSDLSHLIESKSIEDLPSGIL